MTRKINVTLLFLLFATVTAVAQILTPVKWQNAVKMTDDKNGVVTMTATIQNGWHLYTSNIPDGGPTPLKITWKNKGVKLVGSYKASKAPHSENDPMFDMVLSWWAGSVTLTQKFTVTEPTYEINGEIEFGTCSDEQCLPPTTEAFSFKGTAKEQPKEVEPAAEEVPAAAADTAAALPAALTADSAQAAAPAAQAGVDMWAPVDMSAGSEDGNDIDTSNTSLWYIIITCFGGGLLALITPCVWPMIPMTMSFFLKKSGSRGKAISNAMIYGASIVIIFVLLGVLVTAIFGASAMNSLATNAIANIIFFLLLVLFAISFFGAFELKLPDSWSSKMDSTAEKTTGLISIFFMAATLVIVSFSCTGPIIGTLLVEAASQGSLLGPIVGMAAFALALAIPFTLFALFPSMLKKMPKSGGWLNTVKVVLGFCELALALKFLSVADLAYGWHILDRETFLALWIGIFGLMGLYLLGMFRFKSDDEPNGGIGVTRFTLALISISFTAYLVPGLWGAPLKATSAFVPPLFTQDFNLYGGGLQEFDDYDVAMAEAAKQGKPVFVDFSGFGCVNCRKMEGAVLEDPGIKSTITENFITVQLMVDDKTPLPQPMTVQENGKNVVLKTIGDKWSYLQRHKFNSNSQPQYVVLDAKGNMLSGPFAYKEDIPAFQRFLDKGLGK